MAHDHQEKPLSRPSLSTEEMILNISSAAKKPPLAPDLGRHEVKKSKRPALNIQTPFTLPGEPIVEDTLPVAREGKIEGEEEKESNVKKATKMLSEEKWNVRTMKLVMAAKKESRHAKGKAFECFVLQDERAVPTDKDSSLFNFLTKLKQQLNDQPAFNGRFQLAVGTKAGYHWAAYDIWIKNGKVHMLCIDAADDSTSNALVTSIAKFYPEWDVYYLLPDQFTIHGKQSRLLIQTDYSNCSRMTTEHLAILSDTDFIMLLPRLQLKPQVATDISGNPLAKQPEAKETVKILTTELVAKLIPELLRPIQSAEGLAEIEKRVPGTLATVVSAKPDHRTLGQYVENHTRTVPHPEKMEQSKQKNKAIQYKKQQITARTLRICNIQEEGWVDSVCDADHVTVFNLEHIKQAMLDARTPPKALGPRLEKLLPELAEEKDTPPAILHISAAETATSTGLAPTLLEATRNTASAQIFAHPTWVRNPDDAKKEVKESVAENIHDNDPAAGKKSADQDIPKDNPNCCPIC